MVAALISAPLPIELLSFTAKLNSDKEVDLNWQTASEINNDYFTVEKSADAVNFIPLEIIKGAGNSVSILNYTTLDKNPYSGITYYRLKQSDFNGDFTYSQIEAVKLFDENNLLIYPNPTAHHLVIESIGNTQDFTNETSFFIFNSLGQKIDLPRISSTNSKSIIFDVAQLSQGNYFISIQNNDSRYVNKFVVSR